MTLNQLAKQYVGDGKKPNLYFVTTNRGKTLAVFDKLEHAETFAYLLPGFQGVVEDRLTGTLEDI